MRSAAFILTLLFLISFIQPMLQSKDQVNMKRTYKGKCCHKSNAAITCGREASRENNNDDPCKSGCNPFMACPICCYIIPEKPDLFSLYEPAKALGVSSMKLFLLQEYHPTCWHPPEWA